MILRGAPMAHDAEFITNKLAELLAYGNARLAEKKQVVEKPVVKRNVQDHMRDKLSDTIGDLEVMFDAMMEGATDVPDFMAQQCLTPSPAAAPGPGPASSPEDFKL